MQIDITGMDKAEILAALYNNSRVQGMGFMSAKPGRMTTEEARELLKRSTYFDYLYGKVMKIDLSSDTTLHTSLYDRDLGQGAAARVINGLRK